MESRLESITSKKLVGKKLTMSYAENKTGLLWGSFMPHRKEILNAVTADLFSLQVYGDSFDFSDINAGFEKWAAVEVDNLDAVPDGLLSFILPAGLYAVFHYKGLPGPAAFQYIFGEWLPRSGYEPDNRPHFELLGEKYRNGDPDSEEEIWIPVRKIIL